MKAFKNLRVDILVQIENRKGSMRLKLRVLGALIQFQIGHFWSI